MDLISVLLALAVAPVSSIPPWRGERPCTDKFNTVNNTFTGQVTDAKTGKPIGSRFGAIADIRVGSSTDAEGPFPASGTSRQVNTVEYRTSGTNTDRGTHRLLDGT